MSRFTPRVPQNFLPLAHLTGGFTLIAVGCGKIGGLGVGLIVEGVAVVLMHTVAKS